ncbi:GNAT family N-acetyltransferase [Nonomuraea rhodomycinica]|uniref:GNAT family N-acetyltransferase n=1 Tax=Nonomuraea rhodomycinica TaxID=1712872 RepID=A0A7Y6MDG2_9ACTN|nr:GNAT family N-acetyltransferase [Nonomuraea rhodomycinica]NUW42691.1 GNAT family N-acetyltransferase [Nonomuraea rhodomycinica]
MHFRTGAPDDAEVIATLHTESWRSAYAGIMPGSYLDGPLLEERTALWADRLGPGRVTSGEDLLLVAEEDGTVQGFVYLARQPDGRVLLDNLHVRPARKRSGIGRLLMGRAFAWAAERHPGRAVYLEVLRDNAPAIAFYERCGGTPAREFVERLPAGFELPVIEYVWTPLAVASWN